MADPSSFSSEPPTQDSPHIALFHSTLPPLEPRVRFVCGPFKRVPAFLAISLWWIETLLLFTVSCMWAPFLVLVFWTGEHALGFRPQTSQGEPLWLIYPSGTLATAHECLANPFVPSHLSVSMWPLLGYEASLQLVFSWLFRMFVF